MQSDFEVTSSVSLPATCQTNYLSFRLPRAALLWWEKKSI